MAGSEVAVAVACVAAGATGMLGCISWISGRAARERRRRARANASGGESSDELRLESGGSVRAIVSVAQAESKRHALGQTRSGFDAATLQKLTRGFEQLVLKAGLASVVSKEGYASARIKLTVGCAAAGALVGSCFSLELSVLLGLAGLAGGWCCAPWALKRESAVRRMRLEGQLAEMIEVVALGLRSGLSFDRAFGLYHEHFDTTFARACSEAQRQWSLGLVPRDGALRALASSYDSPLLNRVVENIVRSLRFGSSLAESLEASALEVRSIHKANVEERVAKAPVKMLVPVGTLILPAMLIFVLGPIMIELMQGF